MVEFLLRWRDVENERAKTEADVTPEQLGDHVLSTEDRS
jgi:hypothetical protein